MKPVSENNPSSNDPGLRNDLPPSKGPLFEGETLFRTIIDSAPAGIAIFRGRELIIETPNQVIIDIIGKGPDIAGKRLADVLPELVNQPFLQILDDVYTTGKPFRSYDTPANIVRNGVMSTFYFDITFSPLFDTEGKVYAILDISVEVTEAAQSRKRLKEIQDALEDALALAKLAAWKIDAKTGMIEYSDRMRKWLGISETTRRVSKAVNYLFEGEREAVQKAIRWALDPASGGVLDMEYSIVNQENGRRRIIHSQGRTTFNEKGEPLVLSGVSQDVTEQRNVRMALEHEVQQRTEELNAANEELTAINEELHAMNEQLLMLNEKLEHSNEDLQQFAHVASHDLKEPVRKIKTFLGIIEGDAGTQLSPRAQQLFRKISGSSDRMFSMINGILEYSTLSESGHPAVKVDLQLLMEHVIQDLEMLIQQKNATIHCQGLPVIEGVETLLYQLFSNLIINALKFSRQDVPPVIRINAYSENDLYVKITVADNGLGFTNEQAEKIFTMFSRLHSKDKFEGTGLGLSLARKIVSRHGGTIAASGVAGEGAVFTITLPYFQKESVI